MPTKSKNDDRPVEHGPPSISPSTVYSQPWWHSVRNSVMSSPAKHINGFAITGAQSQDSGDGPIKETHVTTAPESGGNGNNVQEQQIIKLSASSTPPVSNEHLETNSQMELVGHSIMLTSYPYQDPHYGGVMTYEPQAHPHLLGIHQSRMLLPLEMEEEPVYVNAKQYHGILRRRQSRAKAELEKKVIKSRKPYLHESRHQHAMRRARGCGGRFLNTKKLDSNATDPRSEESNFGRSVNSSGSERLSTVCDGNSDQKDKNRSMFGEAFLNGNSNGHGLSSMYNFRSTDSEGPDNFNHQRGSMLVNQSPYGAKPIK